MSTERQDGLLYMANQIARFFSTQPEGAAGAAHHMQSFWNPSMRAQIIALRRAGDPGLAPLTVEAVDLLNARASASP